MIRGLTSVLTTVLCLALGWVWLLRPPDRLEARFGQSDCRAIEVLNAATQLPISGIEDIALLADHDTLLLSAHDRSDPDLGSGGLYRISLFEASGALRVPAVSVFEPSALDTPFRPHGIGVSPDGASLALINRPSNERAEIMVGPLGVAWHPDVTHVGAEFCRANDLTLGTADPMEITLDRGDCSLSARDLSPWAKTGSVLRVVGDERTPVRTGLKFANGLLDGYVAETRANRLRTPEGAVIALPGGPDNISAGPQGRLIVALHPTLFQIWFYLQGWIDRAPSRIVAVDRADSTIEVLFDDPAGQIFSAATSAILADGRLVAGSVRDGGLLMCEQGNP